ncbi:hypothetical protein [Acetobacterium woodii]|uniref:Lipoprotein n=1 Tax=Acetobacterium woodii (strain ATCC 29683 / DSM 1030 / JCM 2381 / KCTC 1655 / WB1) TaxID=931626 RepID=H6LFX2_ACEWD|nr:hypothetical protein [Acetobacterium woodii]AFA48260.1 hypothetical protein Awo_c14770 [Acetobacterium woodii DSM 1030]
MQRKRFIIVIIIPLIVLLFAGCNKDDGSTAYLTFIPLPTEATIPNGLTLDSVLKITNPIPDDPTGATTSVRLGVFGFTNVAGDPLYYVYGKKESISGDQSHLLQEGFYQVDYHVDAQNVYLALKDGYSVLTKVDKANGIPTVFTGELPFPFYTPVEGMDGLYTFVDTTGAAHYRVYATFLEKNGNFFPATEDGKMVPGALPINKSVEETLYSQGQAGVSKMMVTAITCNNIPTTYVV